MPEQWEQLEFPLPASISLSSAHLPARVAPDGDSGGLEVKRPLTSPRKTQSNNGLLTSIFSHSTAGTRLGFTVAGLCIGAGALILIFVFIMAQVLPMAADMPIQIAKQQAQKEAQLSIMPTLAPNPSPTLSDITPTSNTPGSKYVDNIQIGSIMNMNRLEITQATRDFKVGQRIYITMNVNRAGYQGAVCLDWYVQNTFFTHYAFPTFADPSLPHSTAWSYTASGRVGAGYVNVSWASSTACTDKVLAQRVDFTIDA
ncbi:MAG: hypothetical protein NVS2B12_06580 [Ktedonobacteraceae bacterium]